MYLAHELKTTKRQLIQAIDSYEFEEWRAYFMEINKKPEKPKDSPEVLAGKLKNAFMINKHNKPKAKK